MIRCPAIRHALLAATLFGGGALPAQAAERLTLQVLSTTDLHMYLRDYDYYADRPDAAVGLVRVAPLIRAARQAQPNTLLVDNGDLIQGTPMGDWVARERGLGKDRPHPAIAALNLLGYDAAVLGNHEFNFGLDFQAQAYAGARFPVLAGNVFKVDGDSDAGNDQTLFAPYTILERTMTDSAGTAQTLRIGLLGVLTPQIMTWDKDKLDGRVTTRDIVDSARRWLPEIKAKGADVVVALCHGGLTAAPRQGGEENACNYLTALDGIDAVVTGHAHRVFPGPDYKGFPGADMDKGTINGKPLVMAGSFGSNLGVLELTLEKGPQGWHVVDGRGRTEAIQTRKNGKPVSLTEPDGDLTALLTGDHEGTLRFVRQAVGRTSGRFHSYFAYLGDSAAVDLVAKAQRDYTARAVQGTENAGLPILSAAAPFKAGGRPGPDYYTDIPAGQIAIKNVADLYVYPNQLAVVRISGAQVRDWLEMSSRALAVIDPKSTAPQPLANPQVPSFNFDIIDGVTYRIDLTRPERFDRAGKLVNADAHRIVDLRYQGQPVRDDQMFLVATNNYRANGGGDFPGLDGSNVVYQSPDTVQQIIIDYIRSKGVIEPKTDGTWSLEPVAAPVTIVYDTAPAARDLVKEQPRLRELGPGENGFVRFAVDLSPKGSK
ncbi:bifunctional 2',3'-cyclic-nucleotide 2'-phosphodiesterase/3'-nucleotidase [Oleisolibacter albus]|uniref:bifunctional 2',3'-cyclic-nucleotide 2'-phosphodiesterase/3'-nucleotidase n=1 Tax=Oleisolibacter albus TaxID=2171757 RepID=UPI000DF34E64|nr:bifunctional 2',3'-cyclic-nucleotide 2'-phosphodiesterase/3'-nucleotidase [Oleisolibacter albus]